MGFLLAVGAANGTAPDQEVTLHEGWNLSRNFDNGCTLSFSAPGLSPAALLTDELATDIWLYQDGVALDRFRVVEVKQDWSTDGEDTIDVSAVCYRRLLASRFVNSALSYSATSQGDIVWGLISHTQAQTNGDLGLTLGTAGPSVPRDKDYPVGQNILDAIIDLQGIDNGLSWDVDANLQVNITQPTLYPTRNQPIVMGVNARRMSRPSGAGNFANVALVSGDALATTVVVQEAGGLSTDPRGRWERFVGFPAETVQANLQDAADGLLDVANSPVVVWSVELEPSRYLTDSNYALGDFVTIVQPRSTVAPVGVPSLTVTCQVVSLAVKVTPNGQLAVSLNAVEVA